MPWFLFLLTAASTIVTTWRGRRRLGLMAAAACLALAAVFWPGRFYAEKNLTEAVMPLGLIWLGLLAAAALSLAWNRRATAAGALAVAATLCVIGNSDFADLLIRPLEEEYRGVDPFAAGPLDAVAVLGGGLSTGPGRRVMANASGDRVVLGARLYHAGVAPRLVCTGKTPQLDPSLPSAAEVTETVWTQLGVPTEAIMQVAGENTRGEVVELKRLMAERGWERLGVVTSAWHMGRAERLAMASGLDFTPLPADFQSQPDLDIDTWLRVRTFSIIPGPGAIAGAHMAVKERIARVAGR